MKIALTGHLSGLGECLYQMLSDAGHEVIGFDIQEGMFLLITPMVLLDNLNF